MTTEGTMPKKTKPTAEVVEAAVEPAVVEAVDVETPVVESTEVETPVVEAEVIEPEKKHKTRESTSEKAKKAAAEREAAGLSAKNSKKKLDPLRLRGKKYRLAVKDLDKTLVYPLAEAVEVLKKHAYAGFDASVDLHVKVKTENVRGTVTLPNGSGKTKKVALATDEVIEQIAAGKLDFDVLLATPAQMPKLARYAKLLGPKGLMPSPKAGTVTSEPEKIQAEISGGRIEYRGDKNNVVHLSVGRVSFESAKLVENIQAILQALISAKVQSVSVAPTMGPGIKIKFEN